MATSEVSGRRKASKRPFPAAASEPSSNGPVQATDHVPVPAKKSKPNETGGSKSKSKKDNDVTIAHKVNDSESHDKENQGTKQVLVFNWTSEELTQLITNLSACLPRNDNIKYTTLIDKLDWEKVRFGPYTAAQCKEKWMQIVTKLRRFRTLTDMVTDAKAWLKHPWSSYTSSKKQKHPEMPKKPLTPYFRYFLEKREKYSKDNPEMSMTDLAKLLSKKFQTLPEKKKQKYREAYEKENEIYKQELEKFKKCHPEQFPTPETKQQVVPSEGPDKPLNAFNIFVNDRLKKSEFNQVDKREAMEKLRKLWSSLSDHKKVKWIRKAMQEEQRYGIEVEKYRSEHPDFHPEPVKNVVSKAEKELKDRCDGKPERPPNSGYSLFSRIKLRELKDLPSKSKMGEISRMWKQLSDTDRESLNKQAQTAIAKYKEEYAAYLNNLPEHEREKVENEMKPASKKKAANHANHITIEVNNDISELEAIDGARPKKPLSAMFYFQQEKFAVARQKHPEMSKQDVMKMLAKDYNDLSEKKKEKYKKIAEEAKKAYDEGSTSKGKHETGGKKKLFKGEPKCPPQSGYGLFLSEKLSELTHVDPKLRMTEIPKLWKGMSPAEKEVYAKRVKEMLRKYNKDMQKFLKGLTVAEFQEYDKYRKAKMKKKNNKGTEAVQKTVKKESESDSSDDDSSEDDDDSDKSDGDDSGSASGSGSGSSSGSDDSGSDSGSDDDDDDDDDDEDDDDDDEDDDEEDNEKKNGEDNESSSSDSDSDSGSGSDSGSDSDGSSDSGSDKSDNEEEKSS